MSDLPEGFDLDALAAPIAGDAPAGPDLRLDTSPQSPFFRLRDVVNEARAADKAMETDPDAAGGTQQWNSVARIARDWLKRNKSLVPAVHLTEALVRSDGLRGLRAGTLLMHRLIEEYWDKGLFPMPEEDEPQDDFSGRTTLIAGLNVTLPQPLRQLGIFRLRNGQPGSLWRYKQALEVAQITDKKKQEARIKAGAIPFEQFEQDAQLAGTTRLQDLPPGSPFMPDVRAQAVAAREAWLAFGSLLDEKLGRDSPGLGEVTGVLDGILEVIDKYAPGLAAAAAAAAAAADAAEAAGGDGAAEGAENGAMADFAGGGPAAAVATGKVRNREEALRVLTELSDFFERTEPHSPLAYTLRDAVRRGRMSLADLLAEVLPDANARKSMLIQLGIKPEA